MSVIWAISLWCIGLDGKTLAAVTAHGLVVDPAYRAMSVTLVSAFFRQKAVDLFVSTSAIEAVGKIALAFKSSPLPQADYDTALFWVLKPYSFARVLMQKAQAGSASGERRQRHRRIRRHDR